MGGPTCDESWAEGSREERLAIHSVGDPRSKHGVDCETFSASSLSVPGARNQATSLRLSKRSTSQRRSTLEIRMDILAAIGDGASRPTQIMCRANLSWSCMRVNLEPLVARSLVSWFAEGERRRFELTPKGQELVSTFAHVRVELEAKPLFLR